MHANKSIPLEVFYVVVYIDVNPSESPYVEDADFHQYLIPGQGFLIIWKHFNVDVEEGLGGLYFYYCGYLPLAEYAP